jgi:hypothetical protein
MGLVGERVRIPKWIDGDNFIVRVEVEAVYPVDDPREPCLEPRVLSHLDHLRRLAKARNFAELEKHGIVYVRRSA